ncbi:catechol 1,2-dioxygenase [Rufibacter glacialis]|uniref:catechol 1,2-dioxygenase n=1 Tax=Rufibacter glacialis TaxID=1259555 RepID=A0A5M8QL62_9BACT|nr:catechol 1,2-dioxygenase [Rufibacter glacialis]KAA6435393.1 catechol 1,2-dioxygenase [Rufibacter glacialis]GGK63043.1 catechol 1,2-dioxygenase [Rufibacter glacialis]
MERSQIDALVAKIKATENPDQGSERVKEIVHRLTTDLFYAIEDLDIQPEEIWKAIDWLTITGKNNEWGLVAAGVGLEHFLDLRMDEEEAKAGIEGGTPRTIEGPLYVAGSPESVGYAELETVPEEGAERLYMKGQVLDSQGNPVPHAKVEVWHCNLRGMYSIFDSSQPAFNLRRAIITDENGRYQFKSFVPVGYSCPPGGATDTFLKAVGRHGSRPAHIHFFVTAPTFRKLTTQINIEGDPLIWDDFAFATREELVPPITRYTAQEAQEKFGLNEAFASIDFNFILHQETEGLFSTEIGRTRAVAATL